MKFNEIKYERPNLAQINEDIRLQTELLKNAVSFAQAEKAFLNLDKIQKEVNTAESVAFLRHEIDTLDQFYEGEVIFFDENLPMLEESQQEFSRILLSSPYRAQLEEKYGKVFFTNAQMDLNAFSPDIVPLLQQENTLKTEYGKLIASAQIPFEGGVYTLSQLSPFKQSIDNEKRCNAWVAEGNFYNENGDKLNKIYDQLVSLRHSIGTTLGYNNFIPVAYNRMRRSSYGQEDVSNFRKAVVEYVVPLADEIKQAQAKRTGLSYPLSFSDNDLAFLSGNPRPSGSSEDILNHAKKMYHELSPETTKFIDHMYENKLLDVLSKKGKAGGGFCTSLPEYESPFIFANFNGTSHDVEVMTHEAGHAFNYYLGRKCIPHENCQPTMEACEVHSMSMEFLAWPWANGFFGNDTKKFFYSHLSGAITFLPYGTMVDHFQHEIYSNPEIEPEDRHEIWRKLLKVYMPWIKLNELPFYGEGKGWQRQMHIYQNPFYYIDYCLAQTVALNIWSIAQDNQKAAWNKYLAYTKLAGTLDFAGLLSTAGLSNPFNPETLKNLTTKASKWLKSCDTSNF